MSLSLHVLGLDWTWGIPRCVTLLTSGWSVMFEENVTLGLCFSYIFIWFQSVSNEISCVSAFSIKWSSTEIFQGPISFRNVPTHAWISTRPGLYTTRSVAAHQAISKTLSHVFLTPKVQACNCTQGGKADQAIYQYFVAAGARFVNSGSRVTRKSGCVDDLKPKAVSG